MRRANGTGSIVNLGPNRRRRYAVRVSYLERPGLWRQKYLSYHRTAREAQEALDKYLAANKACAISCRHWSVHCWSSPAFCKHSSCSHRCHRSANSLPSG